MKTTKWTGAGRQTPPLGRFGVFPALLFIVAGPLLPVGVQASENLVSRAEYQALRDELDALRAEVAELRAQAQERRAQAEPRSGEGESDPAAVTNTGRFAPQPIEPVAKWDRALTFASQDGRFSMNVRGRIQPRYEYERREDRANHSSFSIRRARLDFRGHAYTSDLTYRIMPEWNRGGGGLQDAWTNYRFNDFAQLRFGQYNVPFAWQRDSSSNRHQFVERDVANNEFQWHSGRDIGLMLHGNLHHSVRYGAGFFGGEGRDVRRTASDGNLYSARITYAPIGRYPDAEALINPVVGANLALGAGAGYNTRNTVNSWQNADVLGATADIHFQTGRFSGHLTGFYRDVAPRGPTASFDGFGYSLQTGFLLIPDRLFASFRYSHAEPDSGRNAGKSREMTGGVQIYQFGHGAKLHIEGGRVQRHNGAGWISIDIARTQYQLLF